MREFLMIILSFKIHSYDVYPNHSEVNVNVEEETLDCGRPVNFTVYDHLFGIAQRESHPQVPEPELSYLFFNKKDTAPSAKTFDINAFERRLKKAKRERPKSVQLYNQIGNYWRIKGDVRQAIECYRRAVAVSPKNSEVLLNLARVMLNLGLANNPPNLNFLEDASSLVKKSLDTHAGDRSPWKQYLTLGEIYKAYGQFHDSQTHLRHALELAPDHAIIKQTLLDVENIPASTLHAYTILIILFLALGVIIVISSTDAETNSSITELPNSPSSSTSSNQRHLNKVLFRSQHKVFRNIKCRK